MATILIRHPDDPDGVEYELAPEEITRACRLRFELPHASCVVDPNKPFTWKFNPENFWDGYTEIRLRRDDNLEFTAAYADELEVFGYDGKTIERRPRPHMHDELQMRFLGENMTLHRVQWMDLLADLKPDSASASRIQDLLDPPAR